jgi:hypothetical protein
MTDISTGRVVVTVPGLRREVGPLALMFVSLGSVIGSGWLLGALTASSAALVDLAVSQGCHRFVARS